MGGCHCCGGGGCGYCGGGGCGFCGGGDCGGGGCGCVTSCLDVEGLGEGVLTQGRNVTGEMDCGCCDGGGCGGCCCCCDGGRGGPEGWKSDLVGSVLLVR